MVYGPKFMVNLALKVKVPVWISVPTTKPHQDFQPEIRNGTLADLVGHRLSGFASRSSGHKLLSRRDLGRLCENFFWLEGGGGHSSTDHHNHHVCRFLM